MNALQRQGRGARWLLSAPLLVFLVAVVAYPTVYGLFTSLQNRTLLTVDPTPAGLENYRFILGDRAFWASLWFTARFAAVVTTIELAIGFTLALVFNRRFPGKRLLFTATLLPIMVAPALLGVMFRLLLNGDIGALPKLLGLVGIHVSLFAPSTVVPLLVVLDILQWTSFTFLICYAGLQSFPTDLLEAAAVDGASFLRAVRSVVLPLLAPVLFAAGFLRLVDAIRTFDVIYILTGGGPGLETTTSTIYIYKLAFVEGDFGHAAAASIIIVVLLLPLVPLVVRRLAPSGRS